MSTMTSGSSTHGPYNFMAIYAGSSQTIAFTGVSAQSTSMNELTTIVRLFCTQDCYVEIGTNPTATSSSMFIPAGIIQYYGVQSGDIIAVLQVSVSGTLYLTPGATR